MTAARWVGMVVDTRRPFVVMGVSGVGKTTVGMAVARRLELPYADADDFHSEDAVTMMSGGEPLDDADRAPWLAAMGAWLGEHEDGCVLSCSALKRGYRDTLRAWAPTTYFLHLEGDVPAVRDRMRARRDHFMPPSLLRSQFRDLEPLEADEAGLTIGTTDRSVEGIVDEALATISDPGVAREEDIEGVE